MSTRLPRDTAEASKRAAEVLELRSTLTECERELEEWKHQAKRNHEDCVPRADFNFQYDERERLEARLAECAEALVEAVVPLEVIAGQDRVKPYKELSRDLIAQVNRSIEAVRAAFVNPERPRGEG